MPGPGGSREGRRVTGGVMMCRQRQRKRVPGPWMARPKHPGTGHQIRPVAGQSGRHPGGPFSSRLRRSVLADHQLQRRDVDLGALAPELGGNRVGAGREPVALSVLTIPANLIAQRPACSHVPLDYDLQEHFVV